MSYIQPENSNRVNSIKQKFESTTNSTTTTTASTASTKEVNTNISVEKKCFNDKTKESLYRTLSASPIAPRKNSKLQVTRQFSNPGRNIKRSPAFRGDKLSRTKNLHSPTKEKSISLVDKNVKLFEDKPEYGKLGNVKKKSPENKTINVMESGFLYDDVDSVIMSNYCGNENMDLKNILEDNVVGYGKLLSGNKCGLKESRSQSLDRSMNKQTHCLNVNDCKDSVRTTVISRQKNISAISGAINNTEYGFNGNKYLKTDDKASLKLDKFLKNGVEYTKVMKTKTTKEFERDKGINNEISMNNSEDDKDQLPDIREELSRRKYEPQKRDEQSITLIETDFHKRTRGTSKNLSKNDQFIKIFSNADNFSAQTKLNFVPVKDIILKDGQDKTSFGKAQDIFENKLTDTLKAALKAPLPSGPPPKKPPRTFAHSPITNRSPVDDYEEVDGFWQKKRFQMDESTCDNSASDLSDNRGKKIHGFSHDAGYKQFRKSLRDKSKQIDNTDSSCFTLTENKLLTKNIDSSEEFKGQERNHCVAEKMTNLDNRRHHRIIKHNKSSPNFGENDMVENSLEYEPIYTTSTSNNSNLSLSLSKLGIDSKERLDSDDQIVLSQDSVSGLRVGLSPIHPVINKSISSEENSSASPLNISYSPQKFKTSPIRLSSSGRSRSCKDSKEMLDKLEHVLIQHQKACGPKVIIPRTDKFDTGIISSECETEPRNNLSRHKEIFQKRLSRTLEEGKKLGPLPSVPDEPERSRNLGFDCLPSFNCVGDSSIYERIQNPNFTTYLNERSENIYTKSGASLPQNSHFYLVDSAENSPDFMKPDTSDTFVSSPASKRLSNELTTFSDTKKQINKPPKMEEHVYAEPFAFNKNLSIDVTRLESGNSSPKNERRFLTNKREDNPKNFQKGAELHYMCTPIPTAYVETNNNHIENELKVTKNRQESDGVKKSLLKLANLARPSPDKFDKSKIEQLLDQAFGQPVMAGSKTPTDSNTSSDTDSLTSSTSVSEEYATFDEKLQIFKDKEKAFRATKAELHRSQTEKRKHYVRRVSSKFSDRTDGLRAYRLDNLFEVCLLVELNLSTKKPYIKDQYPRNAPTPAWIENFCFPDGLDWPPLESDQNLAYTFVLTDEKGNRRYGYCRRVKPEGAPVCLPLAYCLITKHRASGFYAKLLDELESRHGQPDIAWRNFIVQLYNTAMPKPGEALRIQPHFNKTVVQSISEDDDADDADDDATSTNNNVVINKFTNSYGKTHNYVAMPKVAATTFLNSERSKATEDFLDGLKDVEYSDDQCAIVRLDDHRLEEKDMSQLFDAVSIKVLLILFASLLLERKVVLTCNKLSKLSACVEALQSLLYPFSWPHPFIPFLPNIPEFSEILQAPSPFVIGILKQRNGFSIPVSSLEDGIVVDLDTSKVISAVGDEYSILPSRLQKGLKSALQLVSNSTKSGDGFRNFLVSEAFLRVFVETCAHCDSHIVTQQDGKIVFEKESFVKAVPSRGIQYFLEWFVETTMFNQFIQDRILGVELDLPGVDKMKLFDQRLAEYLKAADKNSQTKKGSNKKKTLGDRFKDLTNFSN